MKNVSTITKIALLITICLLSLNTIGHIILMILSHEPFNSETGKIIVWGIFTITLLICTYVSGDNTAFMGIWFFAIIRLFIGLFHNDSDFPGSYILGFNLADLTSQLGLFFISLFFKKKGVGRNGWSILTTGDGKKSSEDIKQG